MNRREFLSMLSAATLTLPGCKWWPSEGMSNPCLAGILPPELANHDLVLSAWEGIDPQKVWDCHVHLIGVGDGDSGIYINPDMRSLFHPLQYTQFKFYLNASCAASSAYGNMSIDDGMVARIRDLVAGMPAGVKLMLLAFDYYHDENGQRRPEYSAFHTPNEYAQRVSKNFPAQFEWVASIHPYRKNSVELLEKAITGGARAVKWLPAAMGIDPASPLCDPFYETLNKLNVPLLVHTGSEHAVETPGGQNLGNPLLLRRALQQQVKIILSHCATTGQSVDIDKGENAAQIDNFDLFKRLMNQRDYEKHLFADISAITQTNRAEGIVSSLIERQEWHHRFMFGSDYPIPGVLPLISTQRFVDNGGLSAESAKVLTEIRKHNVILYDFVLKRQLLYSGKRFAPSVFESRDFFLL